MSSPVGLAAFEWGPAGRTRLAVTVPVVGILASEFLVFLGELQLALWGHTGTLFFVTLAPLWLREEVTVFQGFVLVPVFRLVNFGMPVFVDLTLYWLVLVYAPLVPAAIVVARRSEAVDLAAGWKPALLGVPVVVGASFFLAEVEYVILQPEPLIPALTDTQFLVLFGFVMVGLVGPVEELLFRGILQQTLQTELGSWTGLFLASVVFAAMHAAYAVPAVLGFTFALGLGIGFVYMKTASLATVSLLHGLMNVFLFGIVPHRGSLLGLAGM